MHHVKSVLQLVQSNESSIMNEPVNSSEGIETQRGLIGFFDVLGYRNIIENNQIKEAATAMKRILETLRQRQEMNVMIEKIIEQKYCAHVVFSDSILVYLSITDSRNQNTSVSMFTSYCANLITELLMDGFPVRGAISFGDYYIENRIGSISLAGKPIVEAYELSTCIDLAGCVVAPSAEAIFSDQRYFLEYCVPLKGRPKQRMMMMNQCVDSSEELVVSRQTMMEKFGAHNKRISIDVLSKINNTLEFLEASKRHTSELSRTSLKT